MITLYINNSKQIFHIQNLNITESINEVGSSVFEIPVYKPTGQLREDLEIQDLQEFNKITLTKTENNAEKVLFRGFIHTIEIEWEFIRITAKSLVGLLAYKILKNSIDFRGVATDNIISECARLTGANEIFTFASSIPATLKKKYEIGRSMLDILKDITSAGYEFFLKENTIYVGENIGRNMSNTIIYAREKNNPRGANITDIRFTRSADNIANFILTKISSSPPYSVQNSESIAKYGKIERYITVNADEAVTPAQYLDKHKNGATEYSFRPLVRDYNEVEIGDIVSIRIAGLHPTLNYEGLVKITEKSYRDSDLAEVTFGVSTGGNSGKTLASTINNMESRISSLERRE